MKEELADECNYSREAEYLRKFGSSSFLGNDPRYKIPWVWDGSTDRVLVMQHVNGVSVGGRVIDKLSQKDKNDVSFTAIMHTQASLNRQIDCHLNYRVVFEGALHFQSYADRPQLDEFPVEWQNTSGRHLSILSTILVYQSLLCLDRAYRFWRNTRVFQRVYGQLASFTTGSGCWRPASMH
jgi:hypothetical protein